MDRFYWTLRLVCGAGLVVATCIVANLNAADEPKPAPPDKKPVTGTIDLEKLDPELAKKLLELSKGETPKEKAKPAEKAPNAKADAPKAPAVKPIALAKAIAIAEKLGKGEATSAQLRNERGNPTFTISLQAADGTRNRVRLSATGEVIPEPEGRKKGKDKDEEGQKGEKGESPKKTEQKPNKP